MSPQRSARRTRARASTETAGVYVHRGFGTAVDVHSGLRRPVDVRPANAPQPPRLGARPRRGTPAATRARLVAAAARVFNRDGYHGTDSNRIARAAGYAPAMFYKHFPDKRTLFLAVYEAWVTAEWAAVERMLGVEAPVATRATRIVTMVVALHRRWRGLRASLRALVATDATARAFYRAQRRRQLDMMARLGTSARNASGPRGARTTDAASRRSGRRGRRSREDAAVLLFTLERVADAIADGELQDLRLALAPTLTRLEMLVRQHVDGSRFHGRSRTSRVSH
jgi:AcrR family transcriptional regulator